MIVQPGLVDDPKYVRLRKALRKAAPKLIAAEVLLRLWAHCQANCRGEWWRGADAEYVESICRWEGEDGVVFEVLKNTRWIVPQDGGVRIHAWEENNDSLIRSWEHGRKGGRPASVNPKGTQTKPTGYPTAGSGLTQKEPNTESGLASGLTDRVEREEKIEERRGEGVSAPALRGLVSGSEEDPNKITVVPSGNFAEGAWPSLGEVLTYCAALGISPDTGRKFWNHYEKTACPKWRDGKGQQFQWPGKLEAWAAQEGWRPAGQKAPVATESLEQLRALYGSETDTAKRAELRAKINRAEGK